MTEYGVKRPLQRPSIHPGEILRQNVLPALRLSVSETARRLGVSRQQVHRILACPHPITVEMALRIGKLVGNGPGLWLRLQQNYDLWRMERGVEKRTGKNRAGSDGAKVDHVSLNPGDDLTAPLHNRLILHRFVCREFGCVDMS